MSGIVTFTPLGRNGEAKTNETVLDAARRAGAPLGNSCGAIGICARCRVRVLSGAENLSEPTAIESRVAVQRGLGADERLACQAVVNGDCEVTTTYW
ncbi:MAG TPA: 2Fe-2S iron-sulfur cluster-binding protein [Thermoanaerobaculia bacterium]|nr:2Fe-2S iron-sulfur cluster-binding protein [Thermoanaerobaculia bacterium]